MFFCFRRRYRTVLLRTQRHVYGGQGLRCLARIVPYSYQMISKPGRYKAVLRPGSKSHEDICPDGYQRIRNGLKSY